MFYHRSPEATSETPDESTLEASNSVNIDQAQERHSIEEKREYIRHLENENERLATDLVHFRDLTHKNNGIFKRKMKSLRVKQQH